MAESRIPEGKARYSLTLTVENVKKYRALMKQLGVSHAPMSNAVDDFLKTINETMERCISKGSVTITDLFTAMGEQISIAMEEDQRAEVVKKAKKMGK